MIEVILLIGGGIILFLGALVKPKQCQRKAQEMDEGHGNEDISALFRLKRKNLN